MTAATERVSSSDSMKELFQEFKVHLQKTQKTDSSVDKNLRLFKYAFNHQLRLDESEKCAVTPGLVVKTISNFDRPNGKGHLPLTRNISSANYARMKIDSCIKAVTFLSKTKGQFRIDPDSAEELMTSLSKSRSECCTLLYDDTNL